MKPDNQKSPQAVAAASEESISVKSKYTITKNEWEKLFSDLPLGNLKDAPDTIKPCISSKEFDLDEC